VQNILFKNEHRALMISASRAFLLLRGPGAAAGRDCCLVYLEVGASDRNKSLLPHCTSTNLPIVNFNGLRKSEESNRVEKANDIMSLILPLVLRHNLQ
jgi:hypothetical protein